jgi:hypothetical protein
MNDLILSAFSFVWPFLAFGFGACLTIKAYAQVKDIWQDYRACTRLEGE